MDWTNTKNIPNTKIQNYLNVFNDFILSNHSGTQEEDQYITEEWQKLKRVIQKNPSNMRQIQQSVQASGGYEREQQKIRKSIKRIDPQKLKQISTKLVKKIKTNNKDVYSL